jgi:hypothetical protein
MAKAAADKNTINRHWNMLCETIGRRYSGTSGEQRAADYIEDQLRGFGAKNVEQQPFEFPNWDYSKCELAVGSGGKKRRITTSIPMNFSVSTPAKGIRGPIVYLQNGSEFDFKADLRGKVGLLIGSLALGDPAMKQRLIDSKLAALLAVDARIPFHWKVTLGAAPQWMDGYTVPTVGIPFMEAARIVRELPQQAEIRVQARTFPAMSQNVVGEIVGREKPDEVIVVSGHHDAVMGITGANDNASGVIFTLEMARLFSSRRPKRTIRFISYGVEEKLSVGAYLYMRSLGRRGAERVVFVLNADSVASAVGEDVAIVTGNRGLERYTKAHWDSCGHPVTISREVVIYSDHFPLNVQGVPSVFLSRPTTGTGSYWTLHCKHDNLENVSMESMARCVETSAKFLGKIASAPRLPFARKIDPDLAKTVRSEARAKYSHPWSPKSFDYELLNR